MNDPINDPTGNNPDERLQQAARGSESGNGSPGQAAHRAMEAGKHKVEQGGERAASQVDDLADAVGSAASRLSDLEHQGLADYASQLANYLGDMSQKLREKNVDELAREVKQMAERNPAMFVIGSIAVGIGLSRFAKAGRRPASENLSAAGDEAEWRGHPDGAFRTEASPSQFGVSRPANPDVTGGGGL